MRDYCVVQQEAAQFTSRLCFLEKKDINIMGSMTSIMWGMLFGAIGMGYFVYGKKQKRVVALLSGVLLCVFPYFVSNVILMVLVGFVLIALPFIVRY